LEDLDKVDVLEPNNAFTLQSRGDVKRKLKYYQGALKDLDKMLEDYRGALEDLNKADVFESNNPFTL